MLVRLALSEPALLCVDEVTAGFDAAASKVVLGVLLAIAQERALLVVSQNQSHVRTLGGRIVLLVGGRIVERQPTTEFFANPKGSFAVEFAETGGCPAPSPGALSEELEEDVVRVLPRIDKVRAAVKRMDEGGLTRFYWLLPDRLGGRQTGLFGRDRDDSRMLRCLGIDTLLGLEEEATVCSTALGEHWLDYMQEPIADMTPPTIKQAERVVRVVSERLDEGRVVAYYCRAGIGRTGTLLVATLIWRGSDAAAALGVARRVYPFWAQSQEQQEFLSQFVRHLGVRPRALDVSVG